VASARRQQLGSIAVRSCSSRSLPRVASAAAAPEGAEDGAGGDPALPRRTERAAACSDACSVTFITTAATVACDEAAGPTTDFRRESRPPTHPRPMGVERASHPKKQIIRGTHVYFVILINISPDFKYFFQ
tara:strand:+ start:655 stop:1047 length:393 start_codon:yes stop_codon:yes gene_type:complete